MGFTLTAPDLSSDSSEALKANSYFARARARARARASIDYYYGN